MFGPGDGRIARRRRLLVRIPQHVGFVVAVVGQAEEIAVAAELGPQRGRNRKPVHFGAQQNFRAVQRPRGEHHFARIQSKLVAVACSPHILAVNPPPAARKLLQPLHLGLRQDGGAGIARHRQIVHVQRVLGLHVAAADAVAAIVARLLLHAVRVRPVDGEVHRDVERLHRDAQLLRPPVQRLHFGELHGARMRRRRQHVARPLIVGLQVVVGNLRRPVELLEDFAVGLDRHVGVDQRGAAQPRPFDHRNVRVVQQFEQSQRIGRTAILPDHAGQRLRKLAGLAFLAAFQNADRRLRIQWGRRQPRCRDSPSVPRSDNHEVVLFRALRPRCG